jgi:hypothetical protein
MLIEIYIDIHITIDLLFFLLAWENCTLCQKCFAAYGGTMWQVCKLPLTHLEVLSIFLIRIIGCPCVKNIIPTYRSK